MQEEEERKKGTGFDEDPRKKKSIKRSCKQQQWHKNWVESTLYWSDFPSLECAAYIPSWRSCFSRGWYARERVRAFFFFLCSLYLFTFFFFIRSYVSTGGLGEALEYVGVEEGAHTYLVKLKAHSKGKPRKVKEESLVRRLRGYSCFEDVVETEQRRILFSRSVDVHVDKRLRFCRRVPKFYGARSSVHRRAVKGILMTISSILAMSN